MTAPPARYIPARTSRMGRVGLLSRAQGLFGVGASQRSAERSRCVSEGVVQVDECRGLLESDLDTFERLPTPIDRSHGLEEEGARRRRGDGEREGVV